MATADGVPRRAVLLALAAGTAGCGIDPGAVRREDAEVPPRSPGHDELARRRAVADARELLDAAVARADAPQRLGAALDAVVAACRAHLAALQPATAADGLDRAAERSTATGTADPRTMDRTADPGPTDPGTTDPGRLVAALTAAAVRALRDVPAAGPGTARLLASIAAGRAALAQRLATAAGLPAPPPPAAFPPAPAATPPAATPPAATPPAASPPTATPPGTALQDATAPDPSAAAAALAAAVEGERAAGYGYAVVAARLAGGERERALALRRGHREAADRLLVTAARAALTPPPPTAPPAWRLPGPVPDAAAARRLAVRLEQRVAATHAALVAAAAGPLRPVAAELLLASALHRQAWAGASPALPGLDAPDPG